MLFLTAMTAFILRSTQFFLLRDNEMSCGNYMLRAWEKKPQLLSKLGGGVEDSHAAELLLFTSQGKEEPPPPRSMGINSLEIQLIPLRSQRPEYPPGI